MPESYESTWAETGRFAPPGVAPEHLRAPPEEIGRVAAGTPLPARSALGPSPTDLLVQGWRFELAGAHHELDGIEEQLGYSSPPDAHVPDRVDALSRRLAGSVVMTHARHLGVIALAVIAGVVIGYLLARRAQLAEPAPARWV